jgi:hypothetical protein
MTVLEAWNGQAGTIGAGANTQTNLVTTVGTSPNCWVGATITFDAGTATVALRNQSAVVASGTTAAQTMTGAGFSVAPSAGDTFVVKPTSKTSPLYTTTVDIGGGPNGAVVFGHGAPSQMKTQKWNQYDTVTEHWCKVGADSTVIWNVHLSSGPVTSFQLFPATLNLVAAINGSNLTLLMPVYGQIVVVINGDWKNRVNLAVGPSGLAPAGGSITYNGSQTSIADGTTLVFEPGVHTLPGATNRIAIGAGSTAYMKPGAYVIGTFDGRSKSNVAIGVGYGSWSGEGVGGGGSVTQGLPFTQGAMFSMFLGATPGGGPASESTVHGNSITGVTIVDPCYYFNLGGLSTLTDAMLLADWYGGMGGVALVPDYLTGAATWARCISVNADDHWQAAANGGNISIANIAFVHLIQSCLRFGYVPNQQPPFPANSFHVADGCWVTSIALIDASWYNPVATNPIVGILLAGDVGQDTWTIANRTVSNLIVEGNTLCEVFEIKNGPYPWPNSPPGGHGVGASRGQALNINLLSITVTGSQGKRSSILGLDAVNTPHDVNVNSWTVGGIAVVPGNWSTYVNQNTFAYNVRVNGALVGGSLSDAQLLWQATIGGYDEQGLVELTNVRTPSAITTNDAVGVSAAQHVIDLWLMHAQVAFDILSSAHVAAGMQAVIAVLWRRGGSSTQIEQVKWDTVFGDDGLLGKVRKTGPRAHALPAISGNTKSKREGTLSGQPIQPWADPGSLPVNFPPMAVPFDDVEG